MKPQPKRLIEVDLPIKRISEQARREKSIRQGHISTLHIWWARRPLAACRAVLCAALWPDPADPSCPESFRQQARKSMKEWVNRNLKLVGKDNFERFLRYQNNPSDLDDNVVLRSALFDFIADFASWNNSAVDEFLETSRILTQTAHESMGGAPGSRPLVVDPFAGGGAIPLEALRVGADTFASDLNPVPVLLNKIVLEYIPKWGKKLATAVRHYGELSAREAESELAALYPKDEDGATTVGYIWARTIRCEGPGCGAELPLIRNLLLAKRRNISIALKIVPQMAEKRLDFEICEYTNSSQIGGGTVRRSSGTCPCCGYTTPRERVQEQLIRVNGGARTSRLLVVITIPAVGNGRTYRVAGPQDIKATQKATRMFEDVLTKNYGGLSLIPAEPLPYLRSIFNVNIYGATKWGDLFNQRQIVAATTLIEKFRTAVGDPDEQDEFLRCTYN